MEWASVFIRTATLSLLMPAESFLRRLSPQAESTATPSRATTARVCQPCFTLILVVRG